jgi:hypothetical protein
MSHNDIRPGGNRQIPDMIDDTKGNQRTQKALLDGANGTKR